MKLLKDRLKEVRKEKKLTQEAIGKRIGVSKAAVSKWEIEDNVIPLGNNLTKLCEALEISPSWLLNGKGEKYSKQNACMLNNTSPLHFDDKISDDSIMLPLFIEVESSIENEKSMEVKLMKDKVKFSKMNLHISGVTETNAASALINGNSMLPVLPNGTIVYIDLSKKQIVDGEIYAIDHGGMLRIKRLYRLPGGGIRITSYNNLEYKDEEYKNEREIKILGIVFSYYVLRNI